MTNKACLLPCSVLLFALGAIASTAAGEVAAEAGPTADEAAAEVSSASADSRDAATLLDPVTERPPAPDFELKGPDGVAYSLSAMRGKPVIVNFWATWCPPCRAEMPSMQRAWEQVADEGIVLVAVNVGEDAETINDFLAQVPVSFPLPMDTTSEAAQRWPMRGLPTTFVVDPQGRIAYRAQGEREWDDPALLDLVRGLKVAGSD